MSIKRETVEERKGMPLASGVLDYFPDALLVVAEVSRVGNEQHHPGEPLHWDKSKSTDEADALLRHLLDRGTYDTDGLRHSGKVAWRALALLQRELDAEAALEDLFADMVPVRGFVGYGGTGDWQTRSDDENATYGRCPVDGDMLDEHPPCGGDNHCDGTCRVWPSTVNVEVVPQYVDEPVFFMGHEVVSEEWGRGDGIVYHVGLDLGAGPDVTMRGVWPPDTRVAGRLTCCGQSEHPLECPFYRD